MEALCEYSSGHTKDMFQDASEPEGMTGSMEELVNVAALSNPETLRSVLGRFQVEEDGGEC